MWKYLLAVLVILFLLKGGIADMDNNAMNDKGTIKIFNAAKNTYEDVAKITKSEEEWKNNLTPDQFRITRKHGTERAFTGEYHNHKGKGIYRCVACGTDLFSSEHKFDSGTGWPSFWQPVAKENIGEKDDDSFFVHRVEVHCPRCGAHLGHVFEDGPPPTGKRYCINSAALRFSPAKE